MHLICTNTRYDEWNRLNRESDDEIVGFREEFSTVVERSQYARIREGLASFHGGAGSDFV